MASSQIVSAAFFALWLCAALADTTTTTTTLAATTVTTTTAPPQTTTVTATTTVAAAATTTTTVAPKPVATTTTVASGPCNVQTTAVETTITTTPFITTSGADPCKVKTTAVASTVTTTPVISTTPVSTTTPVATAMPHTTVTTTPSPVTTTPVDPCAPTKKDTKKPLIIAGSVAGGLGVAGAVAGAGAWIAHEMANPDDARILDVSTSTTSTTGGLGITTAPGAGVIPHGTLIRDLEPKTPVDASQTQPGSSSLWPVGIAVAGVVLLCCVASLCVALAVGLCMRRGKSVVDESAHEMEPLQEAEQGLLAVQATPQDEDHVGHGFIAPLTPMFPPQMAPLRSTVRTVPVSAVSATHVVSATPVMATLRPVETVPMAAAGVDTTHDGRANYFYVGADRNHDGIPDAFQRRF